MTKPVVTQMGDLTVVTLNDCLTVATAARVRQIFSSLLETGYHRLIVDLSRINDMDSTGLGVLIDLLKKTRVGEGELRVAGIPRHLQFIFELTHLDRVFAIYPNTDEALAA